MSRDHSLDPYAILKSLHVQAVHAVAPVSGGTDTALWRVEHHGTTSALRVFRPQQAPSSRRELDALALAAAHGIPVPQVRAAGAWNEHPAVLLSWCAGQPLATCLRRHARRAMRLGYAFGQMQARIHRIPACPTADHAFPDWLTWHQAVDPALEARLRQHAATAPRLLHLDYHPLNVMADTTSIRGVLDWANVHAGDPRADVARTYTILVVEPHQPERERRWYRLRRHLLAQLWLCGYQTIAGRLQHMPVFFAWAGAVMQADLAPRVNNPHSWWQPRHLQRVQRWTQQWRAHM